jgi:hypothetical protein
MSGIPARDLGMAARRSVQLTRGRPEGRCSGARIYSDLDLCDREEMGLMKMEILRNLRQKRGERKEATSQSQFQLNADEFE